jgi:uroporphyrinogen decarboxylase
MIFKDACFRKPTPYTPVWMMRQAGRYLPEYMAVREKAGDFLSLCKNPEMAAEVTLQPIDIVGVDAAILFSDILVIPLEMGMHLTFEKGEGPVFSDPIRTTDDLKRLQPGAHERLTYVYDTIRLVRERLADDKALIGFTGAPWTLITYMIEGRGTKTYNIVKKLIYTQPELVHALPAILEKDAEQFQGEDLRAELEEKGIRIRAGSMAGLAEEAPQAYKDVDAVVETVVGAGIARKVARLKPVAVVKG